VGPVLLICPVRTASVRMAAIGFFVFMHFAFAACLRVDPFPRISLMELLPFLPGLFWDWTGPFLARQQAAFMAWGGDWVKRIQIWIGDNLQGGPIRLKLQGWEKAIVAGLFGITLYGVAPDFYPGRIHLPPLPSAAQWVYDVVGLNQNWGMFSPNVSRRTGWFVVPGVLANGQVVDVRNGGKAVRWARPPLVSSDYPTERWRRYMAGLTGGRRSGYEEYNMYLCRSWNASHTDQDKLQALEIYLVGDTVLLNNQMEVARPVLMWQGNCVTNPILPRSVFSEPEKHSWASPPRVVMETPYTP
jgi:hypothetical protein